MVGLLPEPDPIRLLVVDDNLADVDLLRYALEPLCAAEFTSIRDGRYALDSLPSLDPTRFNVIIVDWQLPGASGDAVAKAILRQTGNVRPVVLLSSILPRHLGEELEQLGAIVMEKPVDLDGYDHLAKRIAALASGNFAAGAAAT